MADTITLRIIVDHPPAEVPFQVQRKRDGLLPPTHEGAAEIVFEVPARLGYSRLGQPVLLGEYAQGPPADRFIYVNSGKRAGAMDSPWDRRAKVPLSGISPAMIEEVLGAGDRVLEGRIPGTSRDGGPVCASVEVVWRMASGHPGRSQRRRRRTS